jgi:hypothetical protein
MTIADWHKQRRAAMGEEAFLQYMADFRAKRKNLGRHWQLDYVDKDGRTGSQLAAEAGRKGGKARSKVNRNENN